MVEGEGETVASKIGRVVWLIEELKAGLRDGQEGCCGEGHIVAGAVEQGWHQ